MAIAVYPQQGREYPDALGNPITSAGAIVDESAYIEDALDEGYLSTWDPYDVYSPDDRTGLTANAPSDAGFITVGDEAGLSAERRLTAGTGITITDGGPEGPITIAAAAAAPLTPSFLTLGTDPTLTNERVLTAGTGISFVDGGPGGTLTVNSSGSGAPVGAQYLTLATDGTLTNERVLTAGAGLAAVDGGAGGAYTLAQNTGINSQSGTTYTPVLTDAFKLIRMTNNGAVAVTIPTDASVAFPVGTQFWISRSTTANTSSLVVTGDTGVVLSYAPGLSAAAASVTVRQCFGKICLTKQTTNAWEVTEDVGPQVRSIASNDFGLIRDMDSTIYSTSASALSITLLAFASVSLPVGALIEVVQGAAGTVSIVAGAGVTVQVPNGYTAATRALNSTIWLRHVVLNTWELSGDLAETVSYVTLAATTRHSSERVLTAGAGISITDGGAGGAVTVRKIKTVTNQPGTTYTLVLADAESFIYLNNAAATTVTIPSSGTANFATGTSIDLVQAAAGQVSIALAGGVSLFPPTGRSAKSRTLNSQMRLTYIGSNSWMLDGDLEETASYVVLGAEASLLNERVLTAGAGITITDGGAGGAVTVAQRSTHFASVSQSVATGIVPGAYAVLDFNGAGHNPGGGFNLATDVYTVPVRGFYLITARISFVGTVAGETCTLGFFLGGTQNRTSETTVSTGAAGGALGCSLSQCVELVAGATVDFRILLTAAANRNATYDASISFLSAS